MAPGSAVRALARPGLTIDTADDALRPGYLRPIDRTIRPVTHHSPTRSPAGFIPVPATAERPQTSPTIGTRGRRPPAPRTVSPLLWDELEEPEKPKRRPSVPQFSGILVEHLARMHTTMTTDDDDKRMLAAAAAIEQRTAAMKEALKGRLAASRAASTRTRIQRAIGERRPE